MSVRWKDWNVKRVKKAVAKETAQNMAIACKFVEGEARENLMQIQTPRSGRAYRQKVLAPRIMYEIEVGDDFVEGRVGIARGKRQEYHGAFYIEIGTKKIPAHPWLRPAMFNNARDIVRLLGGG